MFRSPDRLRAGFAAFVAASSIVLAEGPSGRRVPGWGEVVDPARDCKVTHDETRDRLTIAVPGTPHVLSSEIAGLPLDAPRVVRDVAGGFQASVLVAGKLEPGVAKTTGFDPYHGAGLVVWKDDRNYLRLERAVAVIHGRTTPYLNYELREGGVLAFSRGFPIPDHPVHLKVERTGAEIRAWHSPDGSRWAGLPNLASLSGRVRVGVVAINSSRHPLRAEFERFQIETPAAQEAPGPAAEKPAATAGYRTGPK